MIRIRKFVYKFFSWHIQTVWYVERFRESRLGPFTLHFWDTLSIEGTPKEAARYAAHIQRTTNEELILWF